ncbi:hypothetical protein BJS_08899 [Bradyrhizobium japonicum SEMIA 5079]|nr:hypothetical protein BJS_08899 [Bradyrhizobium japonicum SEMIA 5079]
MAERSRSQGLRFRGWRGVEGCRPDWLGTAKLADHYREVLAAAALVAGRGTRSCTSCEVRGFSLGGARYVAMGAGFRRADLPMFCAAARALLAEVGGNEAAAEKLARSRGHGRLSIALAHRFCRGRG